jgi:hypothetical protein
LFLGWLPLERILNPLLEVLRMNRHQLKPIATFLFVAAFFFWLCGNNVAAEKEFTSTHKQARVIKPTHKGKPIVLNTFCLDKEGSLLACVGGDNVEYVLNDDGSQETKTNVAAKLLQVYSPDGELIRSIELPFTPTALNQAPDGSIFVAGDGKVARLGDDWKISSTADSPHIGDMETFKQRVQEGAKKQVDEMTEMFRDQVASIEERIKKLKEKPEAELTERDKKRLATYEEQKALYADQLKSTEDSYSQMFSGEQMLTQKMGITALAVTSKDVFLCCNALEGYGYEVWRMTHEFSEPKKVVSELGGCCGQCDIQATESHLVLAENTKFKVALLDRDGERLTDFGKGDRKAIDGFGSCCNPMNVRCCDNGDILTAESSIGTIKRFNKEGELIGVVGKAKIGGGCKHVAVAFDAKRDRYYMMNVDKSHICVLVPNAEAPEITPDEALAKEAREGLGMKLIGEWSLDGNRPGNKPAANSEPSVLGALLQGLLGAEGESVSADDPYSSSYFRFDADGKLTLSGGQFADGDNAWEAVQQDGNTLIVSQLQDSIQYYDYKIEFVSDNEATISLLYNENVMASNRYKRVLEKPAAAEDSRPEEASDPKPAKDADQ